MAKKRKLGEESITETPTKKKSKTETPTEKRSKTETKTDKKSKTELKKEKKSKTERPTEKKSKTETPKEKKSKTEAGKVKKSKKEAKKSETEALTEKKSKTEAAKEKKSKKEVKKSETEALTSTEKKSKTEAAKEKKSRKEVKKSEIEAPTEKKSKKEAKKSETEVPTKKKSETEAPTEKKSKTEATTEKKSKTEEPTEKKSKTFKSLDHYYEEPQRGGNLAELDDAERESDSDSADDLADLLKPVTKPQLIELISDAAMHDPLLLRHIHELADCDTTHRNIFVHGLPWDTTKEALESAFVRFGEVEACHVAIDKHTRKAKGYGFVLFKTRKEAARALKNPNKKINNRVTTCQLASIGPPQVAPAPAPPSSSSSVKPDSPPSWRKIYVANVPPETDVIRFRDFFAQFGEIEEGPIGFDFHTGKSRGFALFVYKTVEGFENALLEPNKIFEGHRLHCQKAAESKAKDMAVVGQPQPQPQPQAPQPIPMPMHLPMPLPMPMHLPMPMPMHMPHNMPFFNPMMFMNPMGMFPAGHYGGYPGMGGNGDSAAKGPSESQLGSASSGAAGYGSSYMW